MELEVAVFMVARTARDRTTHTLPFATNKDCDSLNVDTLPNSSSLYLEVDSRISNFLGE